MQHHHIERGNRRDPARRAPDAPLTGQTALLTARELRRIVAEMLG